MNFKNLVSNVISIQQQLYETATAAVNQSLTIRNWLIGYYIVEFEQEGEDRAHYGEKLLPLLAEQLEEEGVKGVSLSSLKTFRQFYQVYPQISQTVSGQLLDQKSQTPSGFFQVAENKEDNTDSSSEDRGYYGLSPHIVISQLSFSHLAELIRLDDPLKRAFYEIESVKGTWSVRELKRQIGSMLFERTGLSKNKEKLLQMASEKAVTMASEDIIRDPYIFEFLGLKTREVYREQDLEKALLDQLQHFLLELGKGFCLEARQKRLLIGNEHYFVDLVFYHRVLRCNVLIDLKLQAFNHGDAGQLNMYLNYFKDNELHEGDNPPIGILLCSGKDESLVKYATGGLDNQLFISQYQVALPSEEELQQLLQRDRARLEQSFSNNK